jgi:tetratricopeptide (TPR) repeat protein
MQQGQFATALRLSEVTLAEQPNHAEALVLAASASIRLGDAVKSIQFAERAIELMPYESTGYALLGRCLLASQQPAKAADQFARGIALDSEQPVLCHLLGQACFLADRLTDAVEAFKRAIQLAPNRVEAHIMLGQTHIRLGSRSEAVQCFRRAYRLEPTSARGLIQLAKAEIEEMEFKNALDILLRASNADSSSPLPYILLGQVHQQCGQFSEAAEANSRAITLQPLASRPYLQLVQCRRIDEADRLLIDRIKSQLDRPNLNDEDKWQLNAAIGKALDDLGEFGEAMIHIDEANRLMLSLAHPRFDHASHAAEIEATIRSLPAEEFARMQPVGSDSTLPIFIVGMVRSGTTLVEQIVSTHSEVSAGGELKFWLENTRRTLNEDLTSVDPERLIEVGNEYLGILEKFRNGKRHVTDKMPINFLFLGAIHLAFPNAKIVHCKRKPLDNCVSMLVTPFSQPVNFLHSRENVVFYYDQYLRMMDHWKSILPATSLIEIEYEDLVQNREEATRRLIGSLGLGWDAACLHPERSNRTIRTPSAWQVRQPVYRSSIGRWRNYEPWLGALRKYMPTDSD